VNHSVVFLREGVLVLVIFLHALSSDARLIYTDDVKPEIIALLVIWLLVIWENVRDFHGAIGGDVD